jgi:DNA-binding beta-propeller fold protein YncE
MCSAFSHRLAAGVGALLFCAATGIAAPTDSYHLVDKYSFGAAPGGQEYFDYITVDAAARRVYVSHGTEVLVLNADTGALVGKISGLTRCHGIAVVSDLHRGFISDGTLGKILIFDLNTLQVVGEAKAANDADCIIYDPASRHVFSFNGDSHNSTAIDPATGNVIGTIDLPGAPEFAVADGRGMIYDNLEDQNKVVGIDSRTLTVKSQWPVAPAGGPTALAADRDHRRLFVAGRNPQLLVVMDADTGRVIQSFPISAGVDAAAYDPETGRIFVSTREGFIHIFHEDSPDRFSEVEKVKTEYGAKTMGYDGKTGRIFVDTADFGAAPAPTPQRPHPNPSPVPGTFRVLVYSQ